MELRATPQTATAMLFRLEKTTAATMIATATRQTIVRTAALASTPIDRVTTAGAISSDTRFITLMSGLIAGPAVSLNGSPTVSPMTVASCAGEPFPPYAPSSTIFFALSQAPPELASMIAIRVPVAMAPAR